MDASLRQSQFDPRSILFEGYEQGRDGERIDTSKIVRNRPGAAKGGRVCGHVAPGLRLVDIGTTLAFPE
ncbi:MAG: hypothetical protein M5U27_10160 [Gaiella sp.]|nr:hypothetical protein [Gaiella sp.]